MFTASQILGSYWDGTIPVNVDSIANAMGIQIIKQQNMSESGIIEKSGINGPIVIKVNSAEYGPRQRFTIAHEIGHLALGHLNSTTQLFRDEASNFTTGTFLPLERAANQFAAELLMPQHVIQYAITERGYKTLDSLATLFCVSEVAMRWRLRNLGIIHG